MASSIKIVVDESMREDIEVVMKSGVKIWKMESVYLEDFLRFNINDIGSIRIINDRDDGGSHNYIYCYREKQTLESGSDITSIKFILSEINENKSILFITVYRNDIPIYDYVKVDTNPDYILLTKDMQCGLLIQLSNFKSIEEK